MTNQRSNGTNCQIRKLGAMRKGYFIAVFIINICLFLLGTLCFIWFIQAGTINDMSVLIKAPAIILIIAIVIVVILSGVNKVINVNANNVKKR